MAIITEFTSCEYFCFTFLISQNDDFSVNSIELHSRKDKIVYYNRSQIKEFLKYLLQLFITKDTINYNDVLLMEKDTTNYCYIIQYKAKEVIIHEKDVQIVQALAEKILEGMKN